jgi:hypothetical protein
MGPGRQQSSRSSRSDGSKSATSWTLRKPKELEAQNIVIDIAEPDFLSDATKRRILATVVVVVIVVAASLGVALVQANHGNRNSDQRLPVVNATTAPVPSLRPSASEAAEPTAMKARTGRPTIAASSSPSLLPTPSPSSAPVKTTPSPSTLPPSAAPVKTTPSPSTLPPSAAPVRTTPSPATLPPSAPSTPIPYGPPMTGYYRRRMSFTRGR